ncbi:MAG: transglycosylase domain-containing protein [Pyrinomonadaceae bacterium]
MKNRFIQIVSIVTAKIKSFRRWIIGATIAICLLIYISFEIINYQSQQIIAKFNFDLRPVSGLIIFSEPKTLQENQELSVKDVEAHLKRIDYKKHEYVANLSLDRGSYAVKGNELIIEPIFPEHSPVKITFDNQKIIKLEKKMSLAEFYENPNGLSATDWERTNYIVIEPEKLQTSILEDSGEINEPEPFRQMNVRRKIASQSEIVGSNFLNCVKAVEDSNFEEHSGVDYMAFLKIPFRFIQTGKFTGASTVEMQTIRNTVLNSKTRGIDGALRKIQEIILAKQLYLKFNENSESADETKNKILTLYANSCYLGQRKGQPVVYGFKTGAEIYFGKKSLSELSLAQMMTLVVMNHGPGAYVKNSSTQVNYEKLKARRDYHLEKLRTLLPANRSSEIDAALRETIQFIDVNSNNIKTDLDYLSLPYVRFAYQHKALTSLQKESPEKYSHLNIYTTVDTDLMRSSNTILQKHLPEIARKFVPVIKEKIDSDNSRKPNRLLATIVAINRKTGQILTFYGGEFDGKYKHSRVALESKIQPASVYKSFVLAEALAKAKTPDRFRFNAATAIPPSNQNIRTLLKDSDNETPKWLCSLTGMKGDCAIALLSKLTGSEITLTSPINVPVGLSGGQEMSPLKITESFNIFANEGIFVGSTPLAYLYADGVREDNQSTEYQQQRFTSIDKDVAFITSNILQDVIKRGTASAAYKESKLPENIEIFGKSGSGEYFTLFVGSSSDITVSVIVNYEFPTKVKDYINGGKKIEFTAAYSATPIWMDFMREIYKYRPDLLNNKILKPDGVLEIKIDPNKHCQKPNGKVTEFFLRGAVPPNCLLE